MTGEMTLLAFSKRSKKVKKLLFPIWAAIKTEDLPSLIICLMQAIV